MRLAYVCTDRDVQLPGPGAAAREVQANLRALEKAGHDLAFFGIGDGGPVPATWRVVRQRAGNGPKELRDHYQGTQLGLLARELWSLSVNHRLGRTLEEERLRSPLDGVVERLSPWSYAAGAFCVQRGVPYVLEIPAPPIWDRWRVWDAELESAAQAVHAFTLSLARLVIVHDEEQLSHYGSLTAAPVVALGRSASQAQGSRPEWARGFVLVHAGRPTPFEDLKTIEAAAALLPEDFSYRHLDGQREDPAWGQMAWADAAVVPATIGGAVDVAPYLAARLPLVIPRGSPVANLPLGVARTFYSPGDSTSLAAAMTAIRAEIRTLPKPKRQTRARELAALATRAFEAAASPLRAG